MLTGPRTQPVEVSSTHPHGCTLTPIRNDLDYTETVAE